MSIDPLDLCRPLKPGTRIVCNSGDLRGEPGIITEALENPRSDRAFLGCARYAVLLDRDVGRVGPYGVVDTVTDLPRMSFRVPSRRAA